VQRPFTDTVAFRFPLITCTRALTAMAPAVAFSAARHLPLPPMTRTPPWWSMTSCGAESRIADPGRNLVAEPHGGIGDVEEGLAAIQPHKLPASADRLRWLVAGWDR
jgi:hypothetical protein